MNQINLNGCFTALVTPFHSNGELDEATFLRLIDRQIEQGISGIVPCGTTGESVTLDDAEYRRVLQLAIDRTAGRVPVICGAGGNNTRQVIQMAQLAQSLGADAILSVCPYYNKPAQSGLIAHYRAIAAAIDIPVILYNVPGRTGVNLTADSVLQLAEVPNIVAVKEASGDLGQIMRILQQRPAGFAVLSGDDALTLPILSAGGNGVISVISNQIPGEFTRMVTAALNGDWATAREIHYRYLNLMQLNFVESNPVPVKTTLAMMGLMGSHVRQPLAALQQRSRELLENELFNLNLLDETHAARPVELIY